MVGYLALSHVRSDRPGRCYSNTYPRIMQFPRGLRHSFQDFQLDSAGGWATRDSMGVCWVAAWGSHAQDALLLFHSCRSNPRSAHPTGAIFLLGAPHVLLLHASCPAITPSAVPLAWTAAPIRPWCARSLTRRLPQTPDCSWLPRNN